MEFLAIGEMKIKIVLTKEERERCGLSTREDGCVSSSKRAVWEILDSARECVGFDPGGDKILVQVYPLPDGGCEMFVTKLGLLGDSSARLVSRSDRVTLLARRMVHYLFCDRDTLLAAVRAIAWISPDSDSSLYTYSGTYVLTLLEHTSSDVREYGVLREFGEEISEELFSYVCEHYDAVYKEHAVENLLSEI